MGHAAAWTPDHESIRIGLCQRRMLRCVFVCVLEPEQKWKCLFLRLLNNHSSAPSRLIRIPQETHSRGGRFPRNSDCGPSPCLLLGEFCVCYLQATPKMATAASQPLNLFLSFESGIDRIGFKAGGDTSRRGNRSLGVIRLRGEGCAVSFVSDFSHAATKNCHNYLSTCLLFHSFESGMDRTGLQAGGRCSHTGNLFLGVFWPRRKDIRQQKQNNWLSAFFKSQ